MNSMENGRTEIVGTVENVIMDPVVGMLFRDSDDLFEYYKSYAKCKGFTAVKISIRRSVRGELQFMTFACSRARKARDINQIRKKHRPSKRIGCKARVCASCQLDGMWKINKVELEHNHEITPSKSRFFLQHPLIYPHEKRRLGVESGADCPSSSLQNEDSGSGDEDLEFFSKITVVTRRKPKEEVQIEHVNEIIPTQDGSGVMNAAVAERLNNLRYLAEYGQDFILDEKLCSQFYDDIQFLLIHGDGKVIDRDGMQAIKDMIDNFPLIKNDVKSAIEFSSALNAKRLEAERSKATLMDIQNAGTFKAKEKKFTKIDITRLEAKLADLKEKEARLKDELHELREKGKLENERATELEDEIAMSEENEASLLERKNAGLDSLRRFYYKIFSASKR